MSVTEVSSEVDGTEPERAGELGADRRSRLLLALGCSLTTLAALHLGYRYLYLAGDQLVLSPKGISWADGNAFRGDWFVRSAPQPHWFFDIWTFIGERFGVLPAAYLLWYLAAIAVFGYTTARLAEAWLPRSRRLLALAIGPLVLLGPVWILGTATPLLPTALPHVLGGALAYLALVGLILRNPRLACGAALASGIVHVQFGAMLAPILLVAMILWKGLERRHRIEIAVTSGLLVAIAMIVTKVRGITASKADYLSICHDWRQYHCYAPGWHRSAIVAGFAGCALACLLVVNHRRDWRVMVPIIILPVLGTVGGVVADRYEITYFGDLARTTNVYRLAALLVPFAAWALVGAAANRLPLLWRAACSVALVWLCSRFLREVADPWGEYIRLSGAWPVVIGIAAAVVSLVPDRLTEGWRSLAARWSLDSDRAFRRANQLLVGAFLGLTLVASVALARPGWTNVPDVTQPTNDLAHFARSAGDRVPPGSTMIVPASWEGWRLWSRQPVIVDCKGMPYGGPPYKEWLERAVDLYVSAVGTWCEDNWKLLTIDDIRHIGKKYDARYAVFYKGDPKLQAAEKAGWKQIYDTRRSGDRAKIGDMRLFEVPR